MELPNNTIVDAGPDWITATCPKSERSIAFGVCARALLREEHDAGNEAVMFRFKGFEGVTVGSVDYGEGLTHDLIRVRSGCARENWFDVYQVCDKVTRFDLQLTARFENVAPGVVISRCWKTVRRALYLGKPQTWHYRRDVDRGDTLEIGRRQSDSFARIYDKERESRVDFYQGCVRFEVELKNRYARSYSAALADGRMVQQSTVEILQQYFENRGLSFPLASNVQLPVGTPRSPTDYASWLQWIRTAVGPRVQKEIGRGNAAEVLSALGFEKGQVAVRRGEGSWEEML